jgi:hypothetical protein
MLLQNRIQESTMNAAEEGWETFISLKPRCIAKCSL